MEGNRPSTSLTLKELEKIINEFKEKFECGTSDPDRFLTLNEIEELWGKLIGDTNVIYSDMIQSMMSSVNEKDLISKKKENIGSEESS